MAAPLPLPDAMHPIAAEGPVRILPGAAPAWLHDVAASRALEAQALAQHPPQALMQRAGLAVARLARAVAPHAHRIWVACGPGNNGGDGLVAARWLRQAGCAVHVTLHGDAGRLPADARAARDDALAAGLRLQATPPDGPVDLVIDALLGLGSRRAPEGAIAAAIEAITGLSAPVLAVDLPSGLSADTGCRLGTVAVRATHTLSLLTLKPGLFTAEGRDHAGQIWLDALGVPLDSATAIAQLAGADTLQPLSPRTHASHKGRFGDVVLAGGAPGMGGAVQLAARAALASGAGRVFVCPLDDAAPMVDVLQPELMWRPARWLADAAMLARSTVVCGCGGGQAVQAVLPALLSRAARLVLDADALNVIAVDPGLQALLQSRAGRGLGTVLTPHPLEAARLLGRDVASVQADRLQAARQLAQGLGSVALLKGSGTVVAATDGRLSINPSGNALLAGGGSGDVLAGWLGGLWAQLAPSDAAQAAWQAARAAAWLHGRAADEALAAAPGSLALLAGALIDALRATLARQRVG